MAGPMVFKDKETEKAAAEFLKDLKLAPHVGVEIAFSQDVVDAAYAKIRAETHAQFEKSTTSAKSSSTST